MTSSSLESQVTGRVGGADRVAVLFEESLQRVSVRTDRMFAWLMVGQWAFAIFIALVLSPYGWTGKVRTIHYHVHAAIFLGGAISSLPVLLALIRPGWGGTRATIAVAQMLWSALLIHLTGGRIETHFHVFGSLAFLAFYRDWRVLIPATIVVAADHFLRGIYWPESVYGVTNPEWWRFLEHAAWVVFIDVFLAQSCLQSVREMKEIASRRAESERFSDSLERRVEERTAQLAEAQRLAQLGSWHWDIESNSMTFSDELYRIFGLDRLRLEPTYEGVIEHVHPEDRRMVNEAVDTAKHTRQPFAIEHRVFRPDGEVRVLLARGRVISDEEGNAVRMVGTAEDLTDRKSLEAKVRQNEKLSAIGQLASGIAHEINNPLAVILGFAQALERRVPEGDPLRLPATSIAREAIRCRNLVRELLTFSRTGKRSVEEVDLNALVRSTAILIEASARTQGVRVVQELVDGNPVLQANQTQLQQILINLGTNALDAMKNGGVLKIRTRQNGQSEVFVDVMDTGAGIPDEARPHIFEPFFTTKGVGEGTGLGLSLVYEILQQHGGGIEVDTHAGMGTTITVRLPKKQAGATVP